jgi:ankyrin repeat protein
MERDESKYPAYNILTSGTAEEAEALLKAGQNPNKVRHPYWESSWYSRNPLWMIAGNYDRVKLLIQYRADVTKRPYIAKVMDRKIISERYPDELLIRSGNGIHECELYKKVKLYLEAGADPNMKGSFSSHASFIQTESHYRRLYNKYGHLPITWAIKYSAFSIVELLLDYGAILDGKSLEYAKETTELSGHRDMEDYIKEVWEKQQVLNIRKK